MWKETTIEWLRIINLGVTKWRKNIVEMFISGFSFLFLSIFCFLGLGVFLITLPLCFIEPIIKVMYGFYKTIKTKDETIKDIGKAPRHQLSRFKKSCELFRKRFPLSKTVRDIEEATDAELEKHEPIEKEDET